MNRMDAFARWLPVLIALALPTGASAQALRGRVVDATSQTPVAGASLRLLSADREEVAVGIADDEGTFALLARAAGEYMVEVERIGYRSVTLGPFRLRASGFAEVTLAMTPSPIPVDSVDVSVRNQDPALRSAGFYGRRQEGRGTFLERADIEKRSTNRMADVLSGLGGVRVITDNGMTDVQLRGSMTNVFRPGGPQVCFPFVFVDGLLVADGKMAGYGRMNLETVRPSDVAGIELYMGESSVPLQFARGGGACGAVLFWTRIR